MGLTRVELENFTAFRSLKLDLCPGVNVLVGANGTGKTHLMKVCYAACNATRTPAGVDFVQKLVAVFLPSGWKQERLCRRQQGAPSEASIRVERGDASLSMGLSSDPSVPSVVKYREKWVGEPFKAIFIPTKEMLANAPGFRSLYAERRVYFEETYRDILDLAYLPPLRQLDSRDERLLAVLQKTVGGEVAVEGEEFFLRNGHGSLEFSLLAEGLRKLALLWLLIRNGAFQPGSILFWDEPETNLNPRQFGVVIDVLLELQRAGVQIFLATHDYVILKELDLRATAADKVAYHALYQKEEAREVHCDTTCNYRDVHPNAIADTFTDLYNREIRRSLRGAAR
ncbi:MAG: AAA family ATPase [Acidobacteria bacterium]|nr:AAA family ATPase [Acidobacteriota bacterium]